MSMGDLVHAYGGRPTDRGLYPGTVVPRCGAPPEDLVFALDDAAVTCPQCLAYLATQPYLAPTDRYMGTLASTKRDK